FEALDRPETVEGRPRDGSSNLPGAISYLRARIGTASAAASGPATRGSRVHDEHDVTHLGSSGTPDVPSRASGMLRPPAPCDPHPIRAPSPFLRRPPARLHTLDPRLRKRGRVSGRERPST